jgi:hypothetical protein
MAPRDKCCSAFDRAQQLKTDNESCGALIYQDGGKFMMGSNLLPLKFCPWCGVRRGFVVVPPVRREGLHREK